MSRVYRVSIRGTSETGALVMPGWHVQTDVPTGGDEPDPSDIANTIWSHLGTALLSATPNVVHVDELQLVEQVLPPDIGVAGAHTVNSYGTMPAGSGNQLPDGTVAVYDIHTGVRSRSSRGWMLWPGPANSSYLIHNEWSSGYMGYANAFAALLDDSVDVGTVFITHVNPVVYSKTRRQRLESPYTFRVTSVTVNKRAHWLRSRMTSP